MKRALFLLVIFCALETNAQNYNIQFAGTGASLSVSSVKVDNMTTSATLTLNGNDFLHLVGTTGINKIRNKQSTELKIFPNPSAGSSRLLIYPPSPGNAVITLYDITGKQAAQIQRYLENSEQEFQLLGLNNGLYLISVKGGTYKYSGKILSNSNINGNIVSIERISGNKTVDEKQIINDDKGSLTTVDMPYITGDRLKFTGTSGIYSTVVTDIPSSDKTITFNFIACTDGDNINYPTVSIGTQTWMTENLKTMKYRNGDLIGTTSPYDKEISGEIAPTYQWAYAGNESNVATYGRLYTWYAVTDSRNVCPTGWHVPNDYDWTTLTTYLGGVNIAGGKLKETGTTHWTTPNAGATNETGFTALPGGLRSYNGAYTFVGSNGFWWSSTEYLSTNALDRDMDYRFAGFFWNYNLKPYGFSVRCLKD
jgi:uncharacterized protein (TIGR02145 family)